MQLSPPRPPADLLGTPDTLGTLLAHYDAGEPLSCERLSRGLLNRGYRLTTTRGRFFLKHHLDADPGDLAPLERRHHAVALLERLGMPVVPATAAREGRTVVVADGGCYALHPWVEGGHRHGDDLTAAQSRRLGDLLGQVHVRLRQVLPVAPPVPDPGADPADTETVIADLLERVRCRPRRDCFDELAEFRLLERRRLLLQYGDARPPVTAATGWVHGDFHPLNLLYRDSGPRGVGEPVAIIDWDRLDERPRAEETVRAAVIFFLRPDGSLDLPKIRAYARAYRRRAEASGDELARAVHRVWWERLNDFWMLRWRYERLDGRADAQFPASAALVVWWSRNYPAVRDAFCD